MKELLPVLLSTGLVYFASLGAGIVVLRRLGVRLYRSEEMFIGFVLGSSVLSLIVFILATLHLARRNVFLVVALLLIVAGYFAVRRRPAEKLAPLPPLWRLVFIAGFATYAILYLANGLVPDTSPDGAVYHIGLMTQYYRAHGFQWLTTSFYANLSEGVEMLFLFAWPFGRLAGVSMVHVLFLLTLPLGMLSYAKRFGNPQAGVVGALLVFLCPIVGKDGTSAYVDVALAAVVFALFCLLQIWTWEHNPALLIPIGLLSGFAYAVKYTAFLAVMYAAASVAFQLRHKRQEQLRAVFIVGSAAALMMVPWLIKNALVVWNPISPLGNRLFPNPYIHVSFEQAYAAVMSHLNGVTLWQLPWELCVAGDRLIGLLGPVFLLSILALAAAAWPQGRQLLLAAALFAALPVVQVQTTRWFIPALPFIALALAMVLCRWQPAAVTVLAAHAVLSWPAIMPRYCDPHAWRLSEFPWKYALRLRSEDSYLTENLGDAYNISKSINQHVPPGQAIYSPSPFGRSYLDRDLIVGWESAHGELLASALEAATWKAMLRVEYRFPAAPIERIRLVQTARSEEGDWRVHEIRFFASGQELARNAAWRLTARPNPWDVQLAFDNNPVTSWSTWEPYRSGMYVEVNFGGPVRLDSVVAECPQDQPCLHNILQTWTGGRWKNLAATVTSTDAPAPSRSRRAAMDVLKSNGLRWLFFSTNDANDHDFVVNRKMWGITPAAATREYRLFHIDD